MVLGCIVWWVIVGALNHVDAERGTSFWGYVALPVATIAAFLVAITG